MLRGVPVGGAFVSTARFSAQGSGSFETNLDALNIGLPGPFSGMLLAELADWRRANLLSFSNQGALMQLGKWPIARHAREQYD